jgi:PAS domain S-box-containing protein
MKSLALWKMRLAFGFAMLTLLLMGSFSYRWMLISDESDRWVRHTQEVLTNIKDLALAIESIESASRGFVLTGEESDLEAYRANVARVAQDQAIVRNLTADNPVQQVHCSALEVLASERIQRANMIINLRRTQGIAAAVAAIGSGPYERDTEFQALITKLQDEEVRLRTLRVERTERYLSQTKTILFLGTFLGILIAGIAAWSAVRDSNKRAKAEEALQQSEEKYRGLLEAAPDGMVVVNQGGEIVLLNAKAERQFRYSRDELLGQKVTNIIPEGFAERLIADGTHTVAEAQAQQVGTGIEHYGRRKDGTEFPIEIMLSPLESTEGILVTAAIRDITVRKEAEALLVRKVEELNRSNEELEQFAYVASHDLQEPLRMVASYTQLLSKRYKGRLDADADEFIAFAVDGASRMQRLIQDLLVYSRVGKRGKELLDVFSEESLQQAIINLRGAIEESGAQVTHDPLPRVMADETQLIQLFQNLVGNAIKYRRAGVPLIHISAARDGGIMWIFSVQDNGIGIDSQFFEKIFGMFQRLHKREEFTGTGMGLAICKKIVERHGGGISVESQPGRGSTFHFTLVGIENKS